MFEQAWGPFCPTKQHNDKTIQIREKDNKKLKWLIQALILLYNSIYFLKPYNIKGTARALYPVYIKHAQYGQYCLDNIGHEAH